MRKLLLELHAYCGLACAIPLLAFGFSSLNFNHDFEWMKGKPDPIQWETQLTIIQDGSDQEIAEAARDSLGLMGWAPWWKQDRQPDKFVFSVVHFGKDYQITTHPNSDQIQIVEEGKGLWATFNSLHFLGESVPNAPWYINSWQYYLDFTIFFILFSILSGIYLWFVSKQSRLLGITLLLTLMSLSGILMVYLWLRG